MRSPNRAPSPAALPFIGSRWPLAFARQRCRLFARAGRSLSLASAAVYLLALAARFRSPALGYPP
jgi:hypothetical protein